MDFCTQLYLTTKDFPKHEFYGICAQLRRCCISIPSNIAEGAGRNSDKEFDYFLSISLGSSFELETQLRISRGLNYISESRVEELISELEEIQKMLSGLKKSLH